MKKKLKLTNLTKNEMKKILGGEEPVACICTCLPWCIANFTDVANGAGGISRNTNQNNNPPPQG